MHSKFFRKSGVTGAERRGVRGDLKLVFAADRATEDQEPTVERASALINSVRYYGEREGGTPAEAMTSNSAALWELLMATARVEITSRTEHMVSFADAKAYLNVEKTSRIRDYMDALSATWVSYDFLNLEDGYQRIGRRVQLMQCDEAIAKDGQRYIAFSMHPAVRQVILESRQYTHLELGAFPRFSSKYSARLYPKLALMAGRDHRPSMEWTPEALAEELGWQPSTIFKFSNFESRVLKPVLEDISQHVRRFAITCEYKRAETRGHPVSKIVLTIGAASKAPVEVQKAKASKKDLRQVKTIAANAALDTTQMPSEDAIRRAATRLGQTVMEVTTRWTWAFADADIIAQIETEGVGVAFEAWVQQQKRSASDTDLSFEDAPVIRLLIADGYDTRAIERLLLNNINGFNWTGTEAKTVRVEWLQDGNNEQRDFTVAATADDIALLIQRYHDIIEDAEYTL